MSFEVDYQTTVDGVTIKCSKPFNELGQITIDDLREYAIAGIFDIATGRGGNSLSTFTPLGVDGMADYMPIYYLKDGAYSNHVGYHSDYIPTLNAPHYGFSILTYGLQWQNVRNTTSDARLVLDVDIQKLYVDTPTLYENTINKNNDANLSTLDSITYYETHDVGVVKTIDNDDNTQIHCMDVFIYNNQFYIFPSSYVGGMPRVTSLYRWYNNWQSAAADQINTSFIQPYYRNNDEVYASFADDSSLDGFTLNNIEWAQSWKIILDLPQNEREQSDACVVLTYSGSSGWEGTCTSYPKHGLRSALLGFANSCLKFKYNNKMYKPLISDGVVYDYTDDLTLENDFDNITNVTGNNIPITPPAPPIPDKHDNEIEMDLSHYSTLNGFIQYYLMGISTVDDLAAAMNRFDITLIGKDLLPNLISYKMFAIPSGNFSTGTTRTITIAGHEMKKVNDDPIQAPIVLDITPITLDTITIPHTYYDFRDYDPFTKIEMFVPFCGWFTLPPWCMGRAISGTMYIDLPNGTVKAVIKASQTVVAEIGGSCAVDVPFVAQSVGSKTAAVISNMANGLIATADPTPQSLVASSMGIATALNRNYTQCKGVMGDGSNVQGLNRVYIKVTRPAPTENTNGTISARYKHERGLPCGKFLTLAKGDGFTQITDANINGTMTAREKQMIIDGFRHGLIL